MTKAQQIRVRLSECRQKLNTLLGVETRTAEQNTVPVRGDGRLMMSRRRRMNAAASRPAIVRARAGEDRRPPVFGKSGLQSAVSCESPLSICPTLTRDWIHRTS